MNSGTVLIREGRSNTWRLMGLTMLLAIGVPVGLRAAVKTVTLWPAPAAEQLSEDYTLRVSGKPVSVYSCRVSAVPLNQVWPGYQRPKDQTELAGFAHWGMSGPVTVDVTAKQPFKDAVTRPGARRRHHRHARTQGTLSPSDGRGRVVPRGTGGATRNRIGPACPPRATRV